MKAMIRMLVAAALALVLGAPALQAQDQKKPLDHEAYDRWNRIRGEALSPDGSWLVYALVPGEGEATLVVRALPDGPELMVERGTDATFTDDSRHLVFTIEPVEDSVEAAEKRKKKDKSVEVPGDTLGVISLADGLPSSPEGVVRTGRLVSFEVPDEGGSHIAYLLEPADEPDEEDDPAGEVEEEPAEPGEEPATEEEEEEEEHEKAEGEILVVRELDSGVETRVEDVTAYLFTEEGRHLYYTAENEDGTADGAYRMELDGGAITPLLTGEGNYVKLAVAEETGAAAFLSNRADWSAEQPAFALYAAGAGDGTATVLAAADAPGLPEGWWIAEDGSVGFSDSGERVFFATEPRPEPEPDGDEEEDDEEEVKVDVWNWKDGYLQPMQLVQAERERNRTYQAVVPADGGAVVQLETEELPDVRVGRDGDADVALAVADEPYRQLLSWDGRYYDVYTVDVETGVSRKVVDRLHGFGGARLSPDARFVYWWDGEDRSWFALDVDGGEPVNMTAGVPYPVHDELDDHPDEPPPYSFALQWTEGDEWALVSDRFDVWAVDPAGVREPRNLTEGTGRDQGIRFRVVDMDRERDFIAMDEDVILSAFHRTTKDAGFYRDRFDGGVAPERLIMGPYAYGFPRKAEDDDRVVVSRESFQEFPDLWATDLDFSDPEKVTAANPQQSEYLWGTAELVEWHSADGIPLQGILYKPEGFDPSKEYPMMVYFYERMSDGLHRHIVPSAGSSSINRSFYVSRGYLLFVPDIPYEVGHPGESASDAVVPGVLAQVDKGFVDMDRIGVQGHSWGGYQIAYMVTKTNLFAAAEAGAPVSNMTSAYGGIRWGTGMSRMFQYEKTQSRIGGTLWNAQHLYIENSPLFSVDKIETPLLMMHNDEDGAVPWYQGIEMFVAMRRLKKPVWMLNYNGEGHGLRKEPNREDWAVRMQQFFDHYLKDAPAPLWLAEGVPAVKKGETLGLELVTEVGEEASVTGGGGH